MNKLPTLIVSCLLIIGCQSPDHKTPQTPRDSFSQLSTLLDQYAKNALEKKHTNSVALAVYRDGKMYHNYYGELDKHTGNKPNDSTYYEIASITKVFTGSLAAKAVLNGKINLNDDIRMYLNGTYANLEYEGQPITIKHLLTHTLGFKHKTPKKMDKVMTDLRKGGYENSAIEYTMLDLLEELKTMTLDKKPGTSYEYNSVGPELVAYILEQVYKKPYKRLLNEFLDELDMTHTFLEGDPKHQVQLAHGYNGSDTIVPIDKSFLLGGGFGMISTLPDLMKFMKFQLESEHPLIKESTKTLFEDDDDNAMGYLWQDLGIADEEGFFYSKTGTSNGIQSGILICPDSHYGQIIIINNTSEVSFYDWASLFNETELDLIKYPKINLLTSLKDDFETNPKEAVKNYTELRKQTDDYFINIAWFNALGYDMLNGKHINAAIEIFALGTQEYPKNANMYDNLGEAYFVAKDYPNAKINYQKSLLLDPDNENAKDFLLKIEEKMTK